MKSGLSRSSAKVFILSALCFGVCENFAHADSPILTASEISDLNNATIRNLESEEALDQKSGIDFSTLSGTETQGAAICNQSFSPDATTDTGHKIKMLGTALVYASPSNGSSVLGHVGERFAFCRDNQFFDLFYDYAPFDPTGWNDQFDSTYGVSHLSFTPEEKQSIFDSNFEEVDFNVAQVYGSEQLQADRTIYEAWFNIDGVTSYKMMAANVNRYNEQLAKLQSHQPLPKYKLIVDDCMTPVVQDLLLINPGYISKHSPARLTPTFLFNYVKNRDVDRIIVYPSQREFRILRKRAEGKSTALSWLLPASKDLSKGFGDSWALVYTQTHGLLKYVVVGPATGAANLAAAAAETIYGIITEPVALVEKIFKKKPSNKIGFHRILQGLDDLFDSTAELFSFQIRFPLPTDWTPEEMQFFQNFSQQSLLLKYLGVKYENAPVIVNPPQN